MNSKKPQFYVFTIGLALVFLVVFVVMVNSMAPSGNPAGYLLWGANFNPYTLNNQPWRLFTAIFVHSGLFPLIFNLYSLIILGIFLEKRIGSGWFITVFIFSGLFGSLASDYWNVYAISLGGNGAIFGLYGFYFSYVIADYKNNKRNLIWILVNFFIYLIMIRYFGSNSFVDDAAQLGGMATGMSMFIMYVISRKFKLSILLPVVIIAYLMVLTIGFNLIPQDQLTYFKAFRTFLKLDTQMMKSLKANYLSEKELHKNLQGLDLRWDSLLANFDSLAVFDQKVEEDKNVLRYFTKLRKEQIRLINTGIEEESFIYRDSLDILAEKFNEIQPLNYPLNFDLSEDTDNQPVGQGLERQRLYYDSLWRETTTNNYVFYRIGYKDSLDLWSGPIRDYYKGGNIQNERRVQSRLAQWGIPLLLAHGVL